MISSLKGEPAIHIDALLHPTADLTLPHSATNSYLHVFDAELFFVLCNPFLNELSDIYIVSDYMKRSQIAPITGKVISQRVRQR
jgi:hypothetical protein